MSLFLAIPSVQRFAGEKVSDFLYSKFQVNVYVDQIDLSYLGSIHLKSTLISDHHGDTIIYVDRLESSLVNIHRILNNNLELRNIVLSNGVFNLKTYKGEKQSAFNQFIAQFKPENPKPNAGFIFKSENLELFDMDFFLINENREREKVVYYQEIKGRVDYLYVYPESLEIGVSKVRMTDNFGLNYKELSTDFFYSKTEMRFDNTLIETDVSKISTEVDFTYPEGGLSDFENKVNMSVSFGDSHISALDLNKFYKEIKSKQDIRFLGDFNGNLNDFEVSDLELISDAGMIIVTDMHFKNALNPEKQFEFDAWMQNATFNDTILKQTFPNLVGKHLPKEIKRLGRISVDGELNLRGKNLKTEVNVYTDIGFVHTNLDLNRMGTIKDLNYQGGLELKDFNLGLFLDQNKFGQVSMEGELQGEGVGIDIMKTYFDGEIKNLDFLNYSYNDIHADGQFLNKRFEGKLNIKDPNFNVDFFGIADLSSELYNFDFNANILYADLYKLNFTPSDTLSVIKGKLDVDLVGNSIENLIGATRFTDWTYENSVDQYYFEDFKLDSYSKNGLKSFSVVSEDIISGYLKGNFIFSQIPKVLRNVVGSQFSNYEAWETSPGQFLEFDFEIYNKIVELFFPEFKLSKGTLISGKLNSERELLQLNYQAPELLIGENYFKDIKLSIDSEKQDSLVGFKTERFRNNVYSLSKIQLQSTILNDTVRFKSDFKGGKELSENYDLNFYISYENRDEINFGILNSVIQFKGNSWVINPDNDLSTNHVKMNFAESHFKLNDIAISNKNEMIGLKGEVKDSSYKNLLFSFSEVRLNAITPKIDSLKLNGIVNGQVNFLEEDDYYTPTGILDIDSLSVNGSKQGKLHAVMESVDGSISKYYVDLDLKRNLFKGLKAKGYLDFTQDIPQIDLEASLEEFKLDLFSPLGKDVLSNIRGTASGNFNLSGNMNNPDMIGALKLKDAGLRFPYLNVDFDFVGDPEVDLFQQSFVFNDLSLIDTKHDTKSTLRGSISHYKFKDWSLDLIIDSDRLLALDTPESELALFYGTAFIDGSANIHGATSNLTIDVNAKTLTGTRFIIPLSDVKTVESSNLIYFIDRKKENTEASFEEIFQLEQVKGLDLNFNLEVTKDAVAEIVIDKSSGSSLKGSGTGNLILEIDTKGKFNMFGDFTIDNGIYNFSYGGIINKPFTAKKGGVISWSGSPYLADLNIEAVHTVYANPKSLLENINTNRRIPVDLVTKITGELYSTNQEFDIVIPNSSSVVTSELDFVLNNNDTNERMRQFFSLLITKNFYNENNLSNAGSAAVTGTTTDLISGVLSDILNSPDSKLQVDVGYSVADKSDVNNINMDDQLDISLATQINDRILINGKVGVPVGTGTGTDQDNSVIGEVKVEFLMNEEGTFRTTIFNRQNEIQYSDEEEGYTQGVGMSYQIDFDNLKEVWAKFKKKSKRLTRPEDVKLDSLSQFEELLLVVPNGY
ncbi:MAG: translocation/assembly module TamB domain-containing protein [Flavobacteriaceae bacterium]